MLVDVAFTYRRRKFFLMAFMGLNLHCSIVGVCVSSSHMIQYNNTIYFCALLVVIRFIQLFKLLFCPSK